jgi:hypothetical protein
MINTHYFVRPPILDPTAFAAFAADVRKVMDATPSGVVLCGRDAIGLPHVTSAVVAFNGDRTNGLDHEPFVVEQTYTLRPPSRMRDGVFFDFCKTHGKPYDLVVVACLYAFIRRFPNCKFTSDSNLEELKPGFDLFFNTCNPTGDLQRLYSRPVEDKHA